jgi:hypothetical protein
MLFWVPSMGSILRPFPLAFNFLRSHSCFSARRHPIVAVSDQEKLASALNIIDIFGDSPRLCGTLTPIIGISEKARHGTPLKGPSFLTLSSSQIMAGL